MGVTSSFHSEAGCLDVVAMIAIWPIWLIVLPIANKDDKLWKISDDQLLWLSFQYFEDLKCTWNWLVVWNMNFIFHNIWDDPSH